MNWWSRRDRRHICTPSLDQNAKGTRNENLELRCHDLRSTHLVSTALGDVQRGSDLSQRGILGVERKTARGGMVETFE